MPNMPREIYGNDRQTGKTVTFNHKIKLSYMYIKTKKKKKVGLQSKNLLSKWPKSWISHFSSNQIMNFLWDKTSTFGESNSYNDQEQTVAWFSPISICFVRCEHVSIWLVSIQKKTLRVKLTQKLRNEFFNIDVRAVPQLFRSIWNINVFTGRYKWKLMT